MYLPATQIAVGSSLSLPDQISVVHADIISCKNDIAFDTNIISSL